MDPLLDSVLAFLLFAAFSVTGIVLTLGTKIAIWKFTLAMAIGTSILQQVAGANEVWFEFILDTLIAWGILAALAWVARKLFRTILRLDKKTTD